MKKSISIILCISMLCFLTFPAFAGGLFGLSEGHSCGRTVNVSHSTNSSNPGIGIKPGVLNFSSGSSSSRTINISHSVSHGHRLTIK